MCLRVEDEQRWVVQLLHKLGCRNPWTHEKHLHTTVCVLVHALYMGYMWEMGAFCFVPKTFKDLFENLG